MMKKRVHFTSTSNEGFITFDNRSNDMSRKALRNFLYESSGVSEKIVHLSKLARNIPNDSNPYAKQLEILLERVHHLVSSITVDILGVELPDVAVLEKMTAPMYYADIYKSENMHVSLFGFKNRHFILPLHDHPEMYGFLKVIRGSVEANSYTKLSHDEQEEVRRSKHCWPSANTVVARFEGSEDRWNCDECVDFSPTNGNIHSVMSLEDGSAFFDLLIPGYGNRPCSYFKTITQKPKQKQTCLLVKTDEPEDYFCQILPYETIKVL